MNDEQLDDIKRAHRSEGASRVFNVVFAASIPVVLTAAFIDGLSPGRAILFCAIYYSTIAFLAAALSKR